MSPLTEAPSSSQWSTGKQGAPGNKSAIYAHVYSLTPLLEQTASELGTMDSEQLLQFCGLLFFLFCLSVDRSTEFPCLQSLIAL